MTLSLPDMILESCRVVFQLLATMLALEPGALEYRVNMRAKMCRWGGLTSGASIIPKLVQWYVMIGSILFGIVS
jgi:hypothetical protein